MPSLFEEENVSQPLGQPIRLFVAESSPISSQLLAEALAKDSRLHVVGFSSDPSEILRILGASLLDVFLVSARIDDEVIRAVRTIARAGETSVSAIIEVALRSWIDRFINAKRSA